jgi:hypothetical protein
MMKKRDFIKLSAGATVGVAALVAAPVSKQHYWLLLVYWYG